MGTATTLAGLLPTHASIGVAAPILLVLLRGASRASRPAASGAERRDAAAGCGPYARATGAG
ncbi:hypothetical protein [Streptomyces sp. A108]|uniref:hypothetical protein n=1 Tax=Streptomyces mayonensis TaxID=2750816 RepID=UPI0027E40F46|nr:hypothetical protein [Streptomyces sp. A108]MBU6531344.1 hypothetical protein [Streptomyces sp. A108]